MSYRILCSSKKYRGSMYSYFSNHPPIIIDLLIVAAKEGNADALRQELSKNNPLQTTLNKALETAAAWGHTECVRILLPHANPANSSALHLAAQFGHTQCVGELIGWSNPKDSESRALFLACEYEYTECIDLLYDVSEVEGVLRDLKKDYPDTYSKWEYLQQKHEAHLLSCTVHSTFLDKKPPPHKKM